MDRISAASRGRRTQEASAVPAARAHGASARYDPRMDADRSFSERGDSTSFDDLNQLLVELVVGAKEILADSFCGAYLQGSFAVGDADAHSDVDFIIVTKDELTSAQGN